MLTLERSYGELDEDWKVLLGIIGEFSLWVRGELVYWDGDFCLVEFAEQVRRWMDSEEPRAEFSYDSIESDQPGLIWFRKFGDRWIVGSIHQRSEALQSFHFKELEAAFEAYVERLLTSFPTALRSRVVRIIIRGLS
jgi:hypothetical protein